MARSFRFGRGFLHSCRHCRLRSSGKGAPSRHAARGDQASEPPTAAQIGQADGAETARDHTQRGSHGLRGQGFHFRGLHAPRGCCSGSRSGAFKRAGDRTYDPARVLRVGRDAGDGRNRKGRDEQGGRQDAQLRPGGPADQVYRRQRCEQHRGRQHAHRQHRREIRPDADRAPQLAGCHHGKRYARSGKAGPGAAAREGVLHGHQVPEGEQVRQIHQARQRSCAQRDDKPRCSARRGGPFHSVRYGACAAISRRRAGRPARGRA